MLKILAIPILLSLLPAPHTMTSIEQVPGTDSLKVVVRFSHELFLRDYQQIINDDLELEFLRSYNPFPVELANNYINTMLKIYVNRNLLIGKILKTEKVGDDIILNLHYRLSSKVKTITVRNTILTYLFSDVENLTIIKIGNFEKGVKLDQEHTEETFILK